MARLIQSCLPCLPLSSNAHLRSPDLRPPSAATPLPDSDLITCGSSALKSEVQEVPRDFLSWKSSLESLSLLKGIIGTEGKFRSKEQHLAADVVLNGKDSLLAVMPTGSGKSLLIWMAAKKWLRSRSILVIVPLIALQEDLKKTAMTLGFSVAASSSEFINQDILLFTSDAAVQEDSVRVISRLAFSGCLGPIFIDEAHTLVLDSEWRTCLRKMNYFHFPGVPLILMTGTAPRWVEQDLIQSLFPIEIPKIVRASTNRPNHAYKVTRSLSLDAVVTEIRTFNAEGRMIVFFRTISQLNSVRDLLPDVLMFHGKMSESEKATSLERWAQADAKVMLATTALGLGVNIQNVRAVLCFDLPYSFEDFAQQAGRGGRDGKESVIHLYWCGQVSSFECQSTVTSRRESSEALVVFASTNGCRRAILSAWMDGQATSCFYDPANHACDNCLKASTLCEPLCITPSVPTPPPTVILPMQSRLASNARNKGISLTQHLSILIKKLKGCVLCALCLNEDRVHNLLSCPCSRKKCVMCLDETHGVQTCPLKKPKYLSESCFRCLFPMSIEQHMHPQTKNDIHAHCPGDYVLAYCLYVFRHRPELLPSHLRGNIDLFWTWLFKEATLPLKVLNSLAFFMDTHSGLLKRLS